MAADGLLHLTSLPTLLLALLQIVRLPMQTVKGNMKVSQLTHLRYMAAHCNIRFNVQFAVSSGRAMCCCLCCIFLADMRSQHHTWAVQCTGDVSLAAAAIRGGNCPHEMY